MLKPGKCILLLIKIECLELFKVFVIVDLGEPNFVGRVPSLQP